jgi:hypothetical protein
MKKLIAAILFATATIGTGSTVYGQTPVENGAKIDFKKETHDYGTLKYGSDGTYKFDFTNTGNAPLLIEKAVGSCGCTVPTYSKEPIAPGAKGAITVKYDTTKSGPINKQVTVTTNAGTTTLYIKGNVGAKPESGSPVNNSGAPTNN